FGPIVDNGAGIIEMSGMSQEARRNMDKLDAAGNTTKALTKGYAVGSAALAAFLLFNAYLEETGIAKFGVNIAHPETFIGGFIGAALVFLFTAYAIRAVGGAAWRDPDGGHDRRRLDGPRPEHRRGSLGQREEIHRSGEPGRQGESDPQGGRGRRYRGRPFQGYRGAVPPHPRETALDDHARDRPAPHPLGARNVSPDVTRTMPSVKSRPSFP